MAQMSKRIRELFEKVPTAIFATATTEGVPNAVPVGAKRVLNDSTILISDQFFNKTLENVLANPSVAVSFWEGHEGYQIKGTAAVETTGERFEETARWMEERSSKAGFPLKSKGAVVIHIDEIFGLAPGPGAGKKLA